MNADSGEGYITVDGNEGDRKNLTFWQNGENLITAVAGSNKNTIVVAHSVGATIMESWIDHPNITAVCFRTGARFKHTFIHSLCCRSYGLGSLDKKLVILSQTFCTGTSILQAGSRIPSQNRLPITPHSCLLVEEMMISLLSPILKPLTLIIDTSMLPESSPVLNSDLGCRIRPSNSQISRFRQSNTLTRHRLTLKQNGPPVNLPLSQWVLQLPSGYIDRLFRSSFLLQIPVR